MHPGPEVREVAVVLMPAGMELSLRAVVAVGRPHRTDDRQPVDLFARRAGTSR